MKEVLNILAIGDSLIQAKNDNNIGWANRFSVSIAEIYDMPLNYRNRGIGGNTSFDILNRVNEEIKAYDSNFHVILGVGINDSRKKKLIRFRDEVSETDFEQNYEKLLNIISDHELVRNIIVAGIIPVNEGFTLPYKLNKYYFRKDSLKYLEIQKHVMKKFPDVFFIDFSKYFYNENYMLRYFIDGLHPNSYGHKKMSDIALDCLRGRIGLMN